MVDLPGDPKTILEVADPTTGAIAELIRYEWRRPDGNLLLSVDLLDHQAVAWWPFDPMFWPVGPVQVWRCQAGREPVLAAETDDGPAGLRLHVDGGHTVSFMT